MKKFKHLNEGGGIMILVYTYAIAYMVLLKPVQ
jgi:hypothetical protein